MTKRWILCLAVILRLLLVFPIVGTVLWYDENYTLLVIQRPFTQMLAAVAGDVHPPLYYLLLWSIQHLLPWLPVWWVSILSLLFGITSLFVFQRILDITILNPRVCYAAMVLFALNSSITFYTMEGRMYALLGLLVLLGVWALLERRWFWMGIFSLLMIWVHNYGLFYSGCLWAAGMLRNRRDWRALTLTVGVGMATFLPWLAILRSQMQTIQEGYWIVTFTPVSVLYVLYRFFTIQGTNVVIDIWMQSIFYGWLCFTLLWMLVERKRNRWWSVWVINTPGDLGTIIIFTFLPLLLAVIGSLIWRPILLYRALIPCIPFMCLLLVLPLSALPEQIGSKGRQAFWLALSLVLPFLVLNTLLLYKPGGYQQGLDDEQVLKVLHAIESQWQGGDIILHLGDGSLVNMLPYTQHPSAHYEIVQCGPVRGALSSLTRSGLGFQMASLDDLPTSGRIWLITEESPMTPGCYHDVIQELVTYQPLTCMRDDPLVRNCVYLIGDSND